MDFAQPRSTLTAASDLLAAAAHLHVQLRRLTGRVTDTEWMAANPDYARAMVHLAREKAQADGHTTLLEAAERLDALVPVPPPVKPVSRLPSALDMGTEAVAAVSSAVTALTDRYVGRLR